MLEHQQELWDSQGRDFGHLMGVFAFLIHLFSLEGLYIITFKQRSLI